ncbi:Rieske (2Fe-2S) protein [Algisphaera agarilytica]|uniref:Nitrite reductase/ring-hydroxylating ferredoxin subunit n=1 Tax=Algisphaera agarilytica TaxID=1385975 RepID=A0A7X0LJS8_9BACT|nr:Rieske (2Fe-2S) protein [Algisphaera agarilytica]MBB6428911.1 nitrite reductase/ring-hydroxylating ferredoxin subunit [Algisphaera agarilytica]
MPNWTDLGTAQDFPPDAQVCTHATIDDGKKQEVVVFNINGELHCMANICPHAGLPLGDGERRGLTITCPYHGYTYNIRNGSDLDDPEFGLPATVYPIRVEGDTVQIDLG